MNQTLTAAGNETINATQSGEKADIYTGLADLTSPENIHKAILQNVVATELFTEQSESDKIHQAISAKSATITPASASASETITAARESAASVVLKGESSSDDDSSSSSNSGSEESSDDEEELIYAPASLDIAMEGAIMPPMQSGITARAGSGDEDSGSDDDEDSSDEETNAADGNVSSTPLKDTEVRNNVRLEAIEQYSKVQGIVKISAAIDSGDERAKSPHSVEIS